MNFSYYRKEIMKKSQGMKQAMSRIVEPIAKEEGLTSLQLFMLANIQCRSMHTVGALAKESEVGQANTSTICKKLERDGFLIRERSLEDERMVTLFLSEKGQATMKRVKQKFHEVDEKLNDIPEEKLKLILQGFEEAEKVFQYLSETSGKD